MDLQKQLSGCHKIVTDLSWNQTNAEKSARIFFSKAVWEGVDLEEAQRMISEHVANSYAKQRPETLLEAFVAVSTEISVASQPLSEFEMYLNGLI